MIKMIRYPLAIAVLAAGVSFNVLADPPGQVDFGEFTPPADGGKFVEIQINSNLLSLAAQVIEKQERCGQNHAQRGTHPRECHRTYRRKPR
jgi:hypothetical protein